MNNNKSLLTLLLALAFLYALYQLYTNYNVEVEEPEKFRGINSYDSDYVAVIPTFANERRAEEISTQTKKEIESRSCQQKGIKNSYVNHDGCSCKGKCRSGKCDPGIDWSVKQKPGYCGKTNDTRWFHMEPRMILKDNSMRCGDNSCIANNGPPGVMDDTASQHIGTLDNLQTSNDMMYDKFQIPIMGTSDLSQNNGIIPIKQDCAMDKAMGNKCSCQMKK
jgi:hypothetical protein